MQPHSSLTGQPFLPRRRASYLRWHKERQSGKLWASPHCRSGGKRQSGAAPHGKPRHMVSHVGGSSLALPTLPPIQPPTPHLEAIACHVGPAAARFPRGGSWQWHFSIVLLPQWSLSSFSHAVHVAAAASLCNGYCAFGDIFLEPTPSIDLRCT